MRSAIVQHDEDSGYLAEVQLLSVGLPRRGFEVRTVSFAELIDPAFVLPRDALAAGNVAFVRTAMEKLRIPIPPPHDYPDCLRPWLARSVERSTLGELRGAVERVDWQARFVKPAGTLKLFQGRRIRLPEDLERLAEFDDDTPIWISEIVRIVSEFRFFVIESEIAFVENYDGDPRDVVDRAVVEQAIEAFAREGAPAAYAIDFALLRDGRTALVEVNEGFSVGTYCDIDADAYARFVVARWDELLASR